MNKRQIILILRQCTVAAILLAVSACSFKKDPVKPAPEVVSIQEYDQIVAEPEQVFSNETPGKIQDRISLKSVDVLERIRSKSGETLLDLAIKYKRDSILSYLLEEGFNPFLYSTESTDILSKDAQLSGILQSFQKPQLFRLVENLKQIVQDNDLDKQLSDMNFKIPACRELVDTLMNSYFFEGTSLIAIQDRDGFTRHDLDLYAAPRVDRDFVADGLQAILNSTSCNQAVATVSVSDVKAWIQSEMIVQLNKSFASIDLVKYLLKLRKVEDLDIELYQRGAKVKIDPRLFILLPWSKDTQNQKDKVANAGKWLNLLTPVVSKESHFYNMEYTSDDICADTLCYSSNTGNLDELKKITQQLLWDEVAK